MPPKEQADNSWLLQSVPGAKAYRVIQQADDDDDANDDDDDGAAEDAGNDGDADDDNGDFAFTSAQKARVR